MSTKSLHIEWHYPAERKFSFRCSGKGKSLQDIVDEIREELKDKGIEVILTEKPLSDSDAEQVHTLFFNGVLLEDILAEVAGGGSCSACGCKTSVDPFCRSMEYIDGEIIEEIPAEVIREAALKAAGLMEKKGGCCH